MITVWRIVTTRFASSAFSGEGARLYGGRWNRKGVPMVYTAESQSLAMLELLVQDEPLRARYAMIPAEIPNSVKMDRITAAELPDDWRDFGAREHLRTLGSEWIASGASAVLTVPSAVVPAENNYLLNPRHPSFGKITIGTPLIGMDRAVKYRYSPLPAHWPR
jgi:RES domain-containing protein